MSSWLYSLEHYIQPNTYENATLETNNKKKPLGPHNSNLKPQRAITKPKPKQNPKSKKTTGKLVGLRKKLEETKTMFGSFMNSTESRVPTVRSIPAYSGIQNTEVMNVEWYDEVTDGFPLPDFVDATGQKNHILSPLTTEQQQLPIPVTPIDKNRILQSPTRPRTPGSGILSPRSKDQRVLFQSPTLHDLYTSRDECLSPLTEPSSFCLLEETCGYDSDDYYTEDVRFPIWSRLPITEFDLTHSTKQVYDSLFIPRNIQEIDPAQLSSGNTSLDNNNQSNTTKTFASIDKFQIGKPVGAGKFGTIYLARSRVEPKLFVAIKVMFKSNMTKGHITQLVREIKHMDTLRCSNIINLYDFFHDKTRIYLVMEYANGGDLYHSLSAQKKFSEREAASIFKQAVQAIKVCHANGIVHRDIKPENFVWGAGQVLKLIDFGWSAPCDVGERRRTLCGTLDYLPPEMVTGKAYGQMADTWCLGVLLYELLTGSPPFEDEDYLVTKVKIKYVSYEIPNYLSESAKRLIEDILKSDPLSRPTLEQILQHPWIQGNCNA